MKNKEILSKTLKLLSNYYDKIEGEKNWCKQTHFHGLNKIKYVEYVGEQCKIIEIKKALTEMINIEDLMQDGIKIFIGNCELPFIKSGLEKAIEKPTWAANVGEIRALNELSMALKTK